MENTQQKPATAAEEITTIKLNKLTKNRLDHLKVYQRETYEEIIKKMLDLLNTCKASPENARQRLIHLERERKMNQVQ